MSALEYVGLALSGVLVVVTLLLTRGGYRGALLWSWAWVAQILTGVSYSLGGAGADVGGVLAALFPLLQLAGLLEFLNRPLRARLLWLGGLVVAAKAITIGLDMPLAGAAISSFTEIPILAVCAYLAYTHISYRWSRLGLTIGFVSLAGLETYDAVIELTTSATYFEWWLWVVVATPVAAIQIFALIERLQHALESAELEGSEGRERYVALVSKAKDVIAEVDAQGRILYVSPNSENALGVRPQDLVGRTIAELVGVMHVEPDRHDRMPRVNERLESIVADGPFGRTYRVMHPDGEERWIEVSASTYHTQGGEFRSIGVARDITDRRRFEQEVTRTHKLESLGLLAAGVAHDFNNLLAGVLGNAELATADLAGGRLDNIKTRLSSLEDTALQAKALTQQLLVYAGKGTMQPGIVDVSGEINGIGDLIKATLGDTVELTLDLDHSLHPVEMDVGQLQQIVMNLVVNARDACPDGGKVAIETGSTAELPEGAIVPGAVQGPYVCIGIQDNGEGMSPETVHNIFDPFFTTKFDGRGLGLASVFGILRMLDGAISVDSVPGSGTRFQIYLPAAEVPMVVDESSPENTSQQHDSDHSPAVLVVDDSEMPRQLVCDALQGVGRDVFAASNGDEAVEHLASGTRVGAILLDLAMPGLSGPELIAEIRRYEPKASIVIMSGYNNTIAEEKLGDVQIDGFLQKPFRMHQLFEMLEQVEAT